MIKVIEKAEFHYAFDNSYEQMTEDDANIIQYYVNQLEIDNHRQKQIISILLDAIAKGDVHEI